MGPPSSEIYLHVGECPEVWLQGHFQGMELRLSNTTNPPSVAYSTESQKTTLMCYKILTNTSSIPSSYFTPHPSPSPRLHHNKALFIPLVKTTSFKCSFFVDVIPLWNSLPSNFVSSSSMSSFKRLIRSHFSTSFW